jgi:hypothetical protein
VGDIITEARFSVLTIERFSIWLKPPTDKPAEAGCANSFRIFTQP